jgi:hypothetical protein
VESWAYYLSSLVAFYFSINMQPIGLVLRRRQVKERSSTNTDTPGTGSQAGNKKSSEGTKPVSLLSIDEQIKLLQSSIESDDDDDSVSESDKLSTGSETEAREMNNERQTILLHEDRPKRKGVQFFVPQQEKREKKPTRFGRRSYLGEGREGMDSSCDFDNSDKSLRVERDADGNVVRLVSAIQESERIAPLPKHLLPAARCTTGNHLTGNSGSTGGTSGGSKRPRYHSGEPPAPVERTAQEIAVSGMERTVREMLMHYEPASYEKKPFFCRVCSLQCENIEDLEAHKLTEFHAVAVRLERTHSFCKHCEKQFTSPDQLKGHMEGKGHKQRVAQLASRKRFNYNAPM